MGEPYKQNDTWPPLDFQVKDESGPIDLTSADSVTLIRRPLNTSGAGARFALEVLPGTEGWVRRDWDEGDHATIADYECEVEMIFWR